MTHNTVPPGILLVQNFLDAGLCDAIVNECDQQAGADHTVAAPGEGLTSVKKQGRISEFIDIRALKTDIFSIVRDTYSKTIAPHFQAQMDWFELPEILRYKPGGEYKPHADADNWFSEEKSWKRVIDRDLSILIYLNEGYQGGEITFPNFGFGLPPKKGLLIAFPSDYRYVHEARPVQSGTRYALVSWAAVKGSERVHSEPREHSTRL